MILLIHNHNMIVDDSSMLSLKEERADQRHEHIPVTSGKQLGVAGRSARSAIPW